MNVVLLSYFRVIKKSKMAKEQKTIFFFCFRQRDFDSDGLSGSGWTFVYFLRNQRCAPKILHQLCQLAHPNRRLMAYSEGKRGKGKKMVRFDMPDF